MKIFHAHALLAAIFGVVQANAADPTPGVNVLTYRAFPDNGTTDNADALQRALDSIQPGNALWLVAQPSGNTYLVGTTLRIPSGVEIYGDPGVVIKAKANLNAPILRNSDTNNGNSGITIRGLIFDGNKANQSAFTPAIQLIGVRGTTLSSVTVTNARPNNTVDAGGIELRNCIDAQLINVNSYYATQIGVYSVGGSNHRYIGGMHVGNVGSAIAIDTCPNSLVYGLTAISNGVTTANTGLSLNSTGMVVVANSVSYSGRHGINMGHDTAAFSASDSVVSGNIAFGNGQTIGFPGAGINVQGDHTARVQVMANNSFNNTSPDLLPAGKAAPYFGNRVGINTWAPQARLHIIGDFNEPPIMLMENASSNSVTGLIFNEGSTNNAFITYRHSGITDPNSLDIGTIGTFLARLRFFTGNGIQSITVARNGFTGIGEVDPQTHLVISADGPVASVNNTNSTAIAAFHLTENGVGTIGGFLNFRGTQNAVETNLVGLGSFQTGGKLAFYSNNGIENARLDASGNFHVKNTVRATDGYFTNTISATDGTFSGIVTANQIVAVLLTLDEINAGTITTTNGIIWGTTNAVPASTNAVLWVPVTYNGNNYTMPLMALP